MEFVKLYGNNQIRIVRGDSEIFQVEIIINGEAYTPQEGDAVRFAARRPEMDAHKTRYIYQPFLVKDIPIDTLQLHIDPEDTKDLPFGKYVYDLQITFADGSVKTFVKPSPFIVTEEVE